MGDMKRSARGVGFEDRGVEHDPFAELADIFESELGQTAFRPAADRRLADAPLMDADFEAAFADALEADMAPVRKSPAFVSMPVIAPAASQSYQNWVAPRGARASFPVDPAARTSPASAASNIETAFRGLSAPANPRDVIVVETQSFAPERVPEEAFHEPAALELDDFDELIASELAAMSAPQRANGPVAMTGVYHRPHEYRAEHSIYPVAGDDHGDVYGDEDGEVSDAAERRPFLARHMAALGGGVVALALLGTVGFFAWGDAGVGGGAAGSNGPLLIKADAEPYKIVPKDPGGRSIPNQNKAVYERVASPGVEPTPTQSALLTDSEEPMDLPVEEEPMAYDDLPGVDLTDNEGLGLKDEARIEEGAMSVADAAPIPVLQPRKVRTMIVRPDGTIVPSEPAAAPPAPAAAPVAVAEAAPRQGIEAPVVNGAPALIEASSTVPRASDVPYSSALVEEAAPAPITAPEPVESAVSGVPVQVADPVEVASIAPRPEAAPVPASIPAPAAAAASAVLPAGGYFVQISSQPSEALAQVSLQTLGNRFANVIERRSVGIQSADIPGKGTFYRVRVATASKDEAATLCNRLKSAGGNCFVAR